MKRAVAFAFVASWSASAFAQVPASDHERAQQHFDAGRAHVKAGRCELAIDELTKSLDFEPSSVGARLNIGDCYVALGRLTDAFSVYEEAEARAFENHDARLDEARRSAASVEAKLVRVIVRERDPAVPGLVLAVDGGPRRSPPWSFVVTPNEPHVLEATAPDGRTWSTRIRAEAGALLRLEVVLDERPTPRNPQPSTASAEGSSLKTAGVIISASGGVVLVAGGVFAALAASFRSDLADAVASDPRCTGAYPDATCDPAAKSSLDPIEHRAFVSSTLATVSLVTGAALLAGGVVLYLAAPSRPVGVRVGGGGAFIQGSF